MPDVEVKRVYPPEETDDKDKKNVDKIFDDVQMHDSKDPQTVVQVQKETESKKRLQQDNQVQAAISVIKGVRVFQNFGQPVASVTDGSKT